MIKRSETGEIVERHRLLEDDLQKNKKHFLSDWNGSHPFVRSFLGPGFISSISRRLLSKKYLYMDHEHGLMDAIRLLHQKRENLSLDRSNLMAGPGSSSLLSAFSLLLLKNGHKDVYYIPPVYYTFSYFIKLLGIRMHPLTGLHLFQSPSKLSLPKKKSVLLLTDPVWHAGWSVPRDIIQQLKTWQQKTGSIIFIDGSFQHSHWDGRREEHTASLDPSLTFRLLCPTKALGMPAFRFAYLQHPAAHHEELLFLYESLVGSSTASDIAFGYRAIGLLSSDAANKPFTDWLQKRFRSLVERQLIETTIEPSCGYFVFATPRVKLPKAPTMTEDYFELRGYPDYFRINLMGAGKLFGMKRI